MRRERGFSLIELLIVVAIILIIAAIALPNLLRARIASNEASAVASMRTISTSELTYNLAYPALGYTDLTTLGGAIPCTPSSTTACMVDSILGSGSKSGYSFAASATSASGGPNDQFLVTGVPATINITGIKGFCTIEDHVIFFIAAGNTAATRAVCIGGTYFPIAN